MCFDLLGLSLLGDDGDAENDLKKLGKPVGEEDNAKAGEGTSNHFFAFFLRFFVGGAGKHSKTPKEKHGKKN